MLYDMELTETNTQTKPSFSANPIQCSSQTTLNNNGKCDKKYVCKLCVANEVLNESQFRSHVDSHLPTTAPFVCAVCDKHLPFRSTLRNHVMSHMVVRSMRASNRCNTKNGSVSLQNTITRNKAITHYWCDLCPYYCRELSKLKRHHRMHLGIKPYKCPDCIYRSYDKTKIRRHYVTHTREKPFRCSKCCSTFTQSGSLKSHLSRVHKMGCVCFQCGYCQTYQTSNLGELRSHVKTIHGNADFTHAIAK